LEIKINLTYTESLFYQTTILPVPAAIVLNVWTVG